MAYSKEVVSRARARLAQAREDRESENRDHLARAYEKLPRLRQLDMELRRTMVEAAQAAFRQGEDGANALEAAKAKNKALQEERRQLAMTHFEEGYLDDSPICDSCGGQGYVGSNMCQCLAELCRQEQKKELTLLSGGNESFSQFRLDYYPDRADPKYGVSPRTIMEKNLQNCRRYALTFTPNAGNLLFVGGTGLGKTFLSACVAKSVADRGYSVVYETANRLFTNLERVKFTGDEDSRKEAEKYNTCDLLIIDDLGTEMPGQFVTAALYSLLNDRLLAGKPMVVSTNLNTEELKRRYSPPIASRLQGSFSQMIFLGEDIRILKQKEL